MVARATTLQHGVATAQCGRLVEAERDEDSGDVVHPLAVAHGGVAGRVCDQDTPQGCALPSAEGLRSRAVQVRIDRGVNVLGQPRCNLGAACVVNMRRNEPLRPQRVPMLQRHVGVLQSPQLFCGQRGSASAGQHLLPTQVCALVLYEECLGLLLLRHVILRSVRLVDLAGKRIHEKGGPALPLPGCALRRVGVADPPLQQLAE
mmetsp:Transcript_49057/g.141018  ORF Transcript_49057/g.141018 Transcript_49057/m.141018 type:complete len:204 (+) Transcript_49057:635-1246(+)